jgi:hypothetical protein
VAQGSLIVNTVGIEPNDAPQTGPIRKAGHFRPGRRYYMQTQGCKTIRVENIGVEPMTS